MENKELQLQNLLRKLEAVFYHANNLEDYEKKVLQEIFNEQDYEELKDMSLSLAECHVIDCIERNELANATAISQKLNITKGGISKITAKLVKKDMITVQRLANNQKESYYTLTPLGKKIFRGHEILHEQAGQQFTTFFSTYSQGDLKIINGFLEDLATVFKTTTEQSDDGAGPLVDKARSAT